MDHSKAVSKRTPLAAGLAVSLALSFVSTGVVAQSDNAFGIPNKESANPAASIVAAPGARGQGWLGQGRSAPPSRNCVSRG